MSGAWNRISRLTGTVVGQAQTLRDKARELREEIRNSDEPERLLVAPLVPGQHVRYVGLVPVIISEFHGQGRKLADGMARELAESFDPRVLFGLLNIVNPVVWVDAVIAPVRMAAGLVALPAQAAVAGGLPDRGHRHPPAPARPAGSPVPGKAGRPPAPAAVERRPAARRPDRRRLRGHPVVHVPRGRRLRRRLVDPHREPQPPGGPEPVAHGAARYPGQQPTVT